jgi:hypothetical protein
MLTSLREGSRRSGMSSVASLDLLCKQGCRSRVEVNIQKSALPPATSASFYEMDKMEMQCTMNLCQIAGSGIDKTQLQESCRTTCGTWDLIQRYRPHAVAVDHRALSAPIVDPRKDVVFVNWTVAANRRIWRFLVSREEMRGESWHFDHHTQGLQV